MEQPSLFNRLGNQLYKLAYPIYRPVYSGFKAYADRAERALLREHLRPGMVVVDAGANIGIYSRFIARLVAPGGTVHSFEPSPENFRRLREATAGTADIVARQMAVGDATKEIFLYVSESLNVDHRTYDTGGEARDRIAIQSTSLDDYFPPGTKVDFMKMDIQGFEHHALRGAQRVLQENPRIKLLLEYWPYGLAAAGVKPSALRALLAGMGFRISILGEGPADFPPDDAASDPHWYRNLFARRE